jgi:hypothetical protein
MVRTISALPRSSFRMILAVLAVAMLQVTPAAAQAVSLNFDFAAPTYHSVTLTAGTGTYDDAESGLWVRIYSDNTNTWSSWKYLGGIEKGQTRTLGFEGSPSFTEISKVEVWADSDGVRMTVSVLSNNGEMYSYSPTGKWIKEGAATFDRAWYPVPIVVNCGSSAANADLCNRIKAACTKDLAEATGCGCDSKANTCDTGDTGT